MMYCKCDGCGVEAPAETNGRNWFKPSKWFERLPEGENVPLQVCSRKCIELVEAKREAEGKKKMTAVFPM
jgi:hypothetical protein